MNGVTVLRQRPLDFAAEADAVIIGSGIKTREIVADASLMSRIRLDPARQRTLNFVVSDLFPQGGDVARAEFWCGLRPMTPDGTPVLGGTPYPNLHVATGHGNTALAAARRFAEATGVDYVPSLLERARDSLEATGADPATASLCDELGAYPVDVVTGNVLQNAPIWTAASTA